MKPRAQIVLFLTGRCFAPNGIGWKEISVAPLLCLRQPCCSRGMIAELDSSREGIWGQSRSFFYNLKACHILGLLFLPTFLVILFFFYLLWSLHFWQVWADGIFWLFFVAIPVLPFNILLQCCFFLYKRYLKKSNSYKFSGVWLCFSSHERFRKLPWCQNSAVFSGVGCGTADSGELSSQLQILVNIICFRR